MASSIAGIRSAPCRPVDRVWCACPPVMVRCSCPSDSPDNAAGTLQRCFRKQELRCVRNLALASEVLRSRPIRHRDFPLAWQRSARMPRFENIRSAHRATVVEQQALSAEIAAGPDKQVRLRGRAFQAQGIQQGSQRCELGQSRCSKGCSSRHSASRPAIRSRFPNSMTAARPAPAFARPDAPPVQGLFSTRGRLRMVRPWP